VDDLLITSESDQLHEELEAHLRKTYGAITVKEGLAIDYVGMTFDFSHQGKVRVTMSHCVQDILSGCGVQGTATTPAGEQLFETRDTAQKATEEERKWFHTHTAKMLYLAKRVRPECLTAVSFLSTRVSQCDADDLKKLTRLLRYLRGTAERGIVLEVGDSVKVTIYIDAAYGVHLGSGKSHSGYAVYVGLGPIGVSSTKQKIVTKSSRSW
jgi:hypothetical protein